MTRTLERSLGMKPCRFIVLPAVLLMSMAAIGCAPQDQTDLEAQYAENQNLRSQKQQLQEQMAQITAEHDDLMARLEAKDAEVAKLDKSLSVRPVAETDTAKGWQAGVYADKVTVGGDILFRSGQATLTAKGRTALGKIAIDLKGGYAGLPVRVYGYTDSDPIKKTAKLWQDNLDLSCSRAAAVTRFLIGKGVQAKRIATIGMGATNPVADNSTRAGKAKNRRVELVVVKVQQQ